MNARTLLETIEARGGVASVKRGQNGAAVLNVAPSSLARDLLSHLKAHKPELVALLAHGNPFAAPSSDAQSDAPALELARPDASPDALDESRQRLARLEKALGTEGAARAIFRAAYDLEREQAGFFALLGRESRHALSVCVACLDNDLDPKEGELPDENASP
jgi:hypothetical protein